MTDEVGRTGARATTTGRTSRSPTPSRRRVDLLHVHEDWIRRLEKQGLLDRELEFLPIAQAVRRPAERHGARPRPSCRSLLAYTKIVLAGRADRERPARRPVPAGRLFALLPDADARAVREPIGQHPLRREIIVTQVVNELVNLAGITFYHRVSQETGASEVDLVRAHQVCSQIYGVASCSSRSTPWTTRSTPRSRPRCGSRYAR